MDKYSTLDIPEAKEPEAKEPEAPAKDETPPPAKAPDVVPKARFNEVYAQWKAQEREAASLAERLAAIEARLQATPQKDEEPDVTEDPSGWKAWYARQNSRPQAAQQVASQQPVQPQQNTDVLVEAARMVWPDYDQVVESQLSKMDVTTQQRIMTSKNPPAEVYRWAKSQIETREEARDNMTFEGGSLEGDAFFEKDGKITPDEQAIADRFGMTEKEWRGHKKAIAKDRARMFGGKTSW